MQKWSQKSYTKEEVKIEHKDDERASLLSKRSPLSQRPTFRFELVVSYY